LDDENGVLVYEIDIRTPSGIYEAQVHAVTGQILKVKEKVIGHKGQDAESNDSGVLPF